MEEIFGIQIGQSEQGFPLGTDSVLLSRFLTVPRSARIADLGAGCGTLGLLLCGLHPDCAVTGLEVDPQPWGFAQENILRNSLSSRMEVLHADVRQVRAFLPAGSFDCVISNPPYFPAGSGKVSQQHAIARTELCLNLAQLCDAASWLLPSGGRFALVHRPERLCDIIWHMRQCGIEPKRIRFVRHKANAPVCLVLIEGRRGGKAGLQYDPDFIEFNPDGTETEAYRAAYQRTGELL